MAKKFKPIDPVLEGLNPAERALTRALRFVFGPLANWYVRRRDANERKEQLAHATYMAKILADSSARARKLERDIEIRKAQREIERLDRIYQKSREHLK
jgi:hypothetical protein